MTHKEHAHHENVTPNNTNLLLSIIVILFTVIAAGAFYIGQNMNKTTGTVVNNSNQTVTNNTQTSDLVVKVIDDVRCIDCNTTKIVDEIKKIPSLANAEFIMSDFSDDGISDYLKDNNITALPALIFSRSYIDK